jgi:hypothetical protein
MDGRLIGGLVRRVDIIEIVDGYGQARPAVAAGASEMRLDPRNRPAVARACKREAWRMVRRVALSANQAGGARRGVGMPD